jgi:hypothetical protein
MNRTHSATKQSLLRNTLRVTQRRILVVMLVMQIIVVIVMVVVVRAMVVVMRRRRVVVVMRRAARLGCRGAERASRRAQQKARNGHYEKK